MIETSRVTLRPHIDAQDPRGDVLLDDRDIGLQLRGRDLERQYWLAQSQLFLLLVTDDIPYEETLSVYLLDESGRLLEARSLGAPYAPGLLTDVTPQSESDLTFSFQGNWRLVVHEKPVGLVRRRRLELLRSRH